MKEGTPNFPFKEGELIAESKYGNVYAYPEPDMVVKQWKEGKRVPFYSSNDALRAIGILKNDLTNVRLEAELRGASRDIFTNTDYVLHADPSGAIVYSAVQNRIENAETLSDKKLNVIGLPAQTLRDLRMVFKMSLDNFIRERRGFDIVGSTNKKMSMASKVFRVLTPLISSENIVVDGDQGIHFVDFEIYRHREKKPTVKRKVYMGMEAAGTAMSIGVIDAVLFAREITDKIKR